MNIFSLLNNDTSELSEEERELVESFNEAIREKLIEALAECEINELINFMYNQPVDVFNINYYFGCNYNYFKNCNVEVKLKLNLN